MKFETTAVVLIGFQNDYFSPEGILHSVVEESSRITGTLENTVALLERLVATPVLLISTPIIFTVRWTSSRGSFDEKRRTVRTSAETFSEDDGFLAYATCCSQSRAAAVLAQLTQRNLGRRYYLHPHVGRLVVLGRGHRPIFETCDRLGDGESPSDRPRYLGTSNGGASSMAAARNDSSFGSRRAVREPRVSRVLATSRNPVQHESKR